ncbi:hypothetical protein [Saccharopolyspora hattusasensis]|uniref:hypothetical protein n=1 Tax=Saccharopolyspora hattusasensis TaxID=1128679 RepID=UPI003D99AACF
MSTALTRVLRRHWLLALLLLAGLALRIVVQLAYRPALLYIDSFRYLDDVGAFFPGGINPIGYELFLWPLLAVGSLTSVAAVQHLLGLGLGAGIYALLRRFEVRAWIAALAAAPGPKLAALAGIVLAAAVVVRVVGVTLVVPAAVFVLLATGWRPRDGQLGGPGAAAVPVRRAAGRRPQPRLPGAGAADADAGAHRRCQ